MLHLNIINKKKILLAIVIVLILLLPQNIFAIVKPTEEFYVNDYAKVLNDELKKYIIETNKNLKQKTGAEVVVVTVNDLESKAIEEYATELFREFKIGDSTKNNGLLILLSINDRAARVEVGYGLEGVLPDAKSGRIQDEYMIPYFKNNDWNNGIMNGYNQFVQIISQEYNADIETKQLTLDTNTITNTTLVEQDPEIAKKEEKALTVLLLTSFATIILGIALNLLVTKKKISKKSSILIKAIYLLIITGILSLFVKDTITLIILVITNLALVNSKLNYGEKNNGYSSNDRHSSRSSNDRRPPRSGGSSGGGGSSRNF